MKISTTFMIFVYLAMCGMMILRVRRSVVFAEDKHTLAMHISLCFTVITVPISLYQIYEHLSSFNKPQLQVQIIRIVWMVPIYSLESMLSIHFVRLAFLFQVVREIYESYVIYCFMRFLLNYLGNTEKLVARLALKPAYMGQHKPPFCFLAPWQMGGAFLSGCKMGVLQCVVIRFALAVISLILHFFGWYEEGDYSITSSYLWMTLANCASQTYALYSLFLFYHVSHGEFKGIRPFEKFLSIKLVIFFSWWQALFIGLLVSFGHINGIDSSAYGDAHSPQEVADGVQDLLICMEMLFAAIAFTYSFSVAEFRFVHKHVDTSSTGTFLSTSTLASGHVGTESGELARLISGDEMSLCESKTENFAPQVSTSSLDSSVLRPESTTQFDQQNINRLSQKTDRGDLQRTLFAAEQSIGDLMSARTHYDSSGTSDPPRAVSVENQSDFWTWLRDSTTMFSYQKRGSDVLTKKSDHRAFAVIPNTGWSGSVAMDVEAPSITMRTRKGDVFSPLAYKRSGSVSSPFHARAGRPLHSASMGHKYKRRYTLYEAIYLTLFMGELRGDLIELATMVIDEFIIGPSVQLKRWMKGPNAIS